MIKFKRYIPIIFLILHCGLIFFFSGQNEHSSTVASDSVMNVVLEASPVPAETLGESQLENVEVFIRKTAHFILFFILGVYAYFSAESVGLKKKIIIALLFCFAYAISDEIHQTFIDGRSGEIRDVIIDICGSALGVFLILTIKKKIKKEV